MPGLSDKIKKLISEIESDAMKEILSEKFQVDLSNTDYYNSQRLLKNEGWKNPYRFKI